MKLTKKLIDACRYEGTRGERDVRWDQTIPGFGVRIYPSGKKAFVISYRAAGRKRLMTLGAYGVLTLDQARDRARVKLAEVIEGDDPLAEREAQSQGETVKDLSAAYIERHAKLHKKSWRPDQHRIDRHLLPAWGQLKVAALTGSDVATLHSRIGQNSGPYEANRVLALVAKMFKLAGIWGFIPRDAPNPARDIDKFREEKRDRWVRHDELPRLAMAIDREPNVYVRAALWMYLFTGVRKSELLTTTWDNVDVSRAEIRLPETKAGRVHYVPLSQPAMMILARLPRHDGNPYVFPGVIAGRPLVNIDRAWQRIRQKAGVQDVRLHDLRRTVGSWLAEAGHSLPLIGNVLNHSHPTTTAVYARLGQDPARKALEDHGTRLMRIAKRDLVHALVRSLSAAVLRKTLEEQGMTPKGRLVKQRKSSNRRPALVSRDPRLTTNVVST